jgi:hypothetical protein
VTYAVDAIQCHINCSRKDVQFAFYLNVGGKTVEQRWYGDKSYTTFKLTFDRTKSHTVVFFVKDIAGVIHKETVEIKPLEIDFVPSFTISESKFHCNIQTSQVNLQYAFYLSINDGAVIQNWYSEERETTFECDETKLDRFEITYFIRDSESNIFSRTIIYERFEPENNINKLNNQFDFFISQNKQTIYKNIKSADSALGAILTDYGSRERFCKIMTSELFTTSINNHIVRGFELEANGSYKSTYIQGYRLDLVMMLRDEYPSLNLPSEFELNNIIQQCDILLRGLREADADGELCGDWALHNLVYSIKDDVIYNVDLEGFMTYDPLPEWANLEKISQWLQALIK